MLVKSETFKPVFQKHKKVVIVGGGESLRGFDFKILNDFDGAIIAVNYSVKYIPRADYFITTDLVALDILLNKNKNTYYFVGCNIKNTIPNNADHILQRVHAKAIVDNKKYVTLGNTLFSAFNLAYHFDPKKILLLGLDLSRTRHWCDKESVNINLKFCNGTRFQVLTNLFANSKFQLQKKNIDVINGSPSSCLNTFKKMTPLEGVKWIKKLIGNKL